MVGWLLERKVVFGMAGYASTDEHDSNNWYSSPDKACMYHSCYSILSDIYTDRIFKSHA
jgi:hypothetical protein